MRPTSLALVAAIGSTGLVGAQPTHDPQVPSFRSETRLVTVYASVSDGRKPVVNLAAKDFLVTDNGVAQEVEHAAIDTMGLDLTMLVDVSGSTIINFKSNILGELQRVQSILDPDDRLQTLYTDSRISRFPARGATVNTALRPFGDGGTALLDGIAAAMMQRSDSTRRRAVIVLTDGTDNKSVLLPDVRRDLARRSNAVVYVLAFSINGRTSQFESRGTRELIGNADAPLREMTDESSGEVFDVRPGRSVADAVDRALSLMRTRYTLRYRPRGVGSGGWHDIQVRVPNRRHTIVAKKGYFWE